MRVGSVIFFVLVGMAGFGYLLADNLQMRREVTVARSRVLQAEQELEAFQEQYDAMHADNDRLQGRVADLQRENEGLQENVRDLGAEAVSLKALAARLQDENDLLKAALPLVHSIISLASDTTALAIFIPILPIACGVTYAVTRRFEKRPSRRSGSPGGQSVGQVNLTREEMNHVIRMRRGHGK